VFIENVEKCTFQYAIQFILIKLVSAIFNYFSVILFGSGLHHAENQWNLFGVVSGSQEGVYGEHLCERLANYFEPFTQMFSIHAFLRTGDDTKQVPLVFCMM
jgi:hypothetical protein